MPPTVTKIGEFAGLVDTTPGEFTFQTTADHPDGDTLVIFLYGGRALTLGVADEAGHTYGLTSGGSGGVGIAYAVGATALPAGSDITVTTESFVGFSSVFGVLVYSIDKIIGLLDTPTPEFYGFDDVLSDTEVRVDPNPIDLLAHAGKDLFVIAGANWGGFEFTTPVNGDTYSISLGSWTDIDNLFVTNTGYEDPSLFIGYHDGAIATASKTLTDHDGSDQPYYAVITHPPPGFDGRLWAWFALVFEWADEVGDGVDCVTNSHGWIFRAYRVGTDIRVDRSLDAGNSFQAPVTVASDAEGDTDTGAAPALVLLPGDDLMVWYHTAAAVGKGYYSENHGRSWALLASHVARRYPVPAWRGDRLLVAAFNGQILSVFESEDFGVTLELDVTFGVQPRQRVALRVDRHLTTHLLYRDDTGAILHRFAENPSVLGQWASIATFAASGTFPGFAAGLRGLATWFAGADLEVSRTDETFRALRSGAVPPLATFKPMAPGVWIDEREHYYILGRAASSGNALLLWYSEDEGASWDVLYAGGGV